MVELQHITDKLSSYRRHKKIRGQTISRESGLSASQISKIESGQHDMRITTFLRYVNSLGMELIIKEKDNGNRNN
jgi:transcriptional regulator with XRE-family HTH domain